MKAAGWLNISEHFIMDTLVLENTTINRHLLRHIDICSQYRILSLGGHPPPYVCLLRTISQEP